MGDLGKIEADSSSMPMHASTPWQKCSTEALSWFGVCHNLDMLVCFSIQVLGWDSNDVWKGLCGYGSLTPFDVHSVLFWSNKHWFPMERLATQWKQVASTSFHESQDHVWQCCCCIFCSYTLSVCAYDKRRQSACDHCMHLSMLVMHWFWFTIWRTARHNFVCCFVNVTASCPLNITAASGSTSQSFISTLAWTTFYLACCLSFMPAVLDFANYWKMLSLKYANHAVNFINPFPAVNDLVCLLVSVR